MTKTGAYDVFKIDIMKGDQFGSDFVNINPNSKIPALLDYSQTPPQPVFESGSILFYFLFSSLFSGHPRHFF